MVHLLENVIVLNQNFSHTADTRSSTSSDCIYPFQNISLGLKKNGYQYQTRTTEWFDFFFQDALRESII